MTNMKIVVWTETHSYCDDMVVVYLPPSLPIIVIACGATGGGGGVHSTGDLLGR